MATGLGPVEHFDSNTPMTENPRCRRTSRYAAAAQATDFNDPSTDSNVVKRYHTLAINLGQVAYLPSRSGPRGRPSLRWRKKPWACFQGRAFGAGLIDNAATCVALSGTATRKGTEFLIFGFSRGAYSAPGLAAVRYLFGLLHPEGLIPCIRRLYGKRARAAKARPPNHARAFSRRKTIANAPSPATSMSGFCGV
jgi:uncharacterized protein (DUF2235 family)